MLMVGFEVIFLPLYFSVLKTVHNEYSQPSVLQALCLQFPYGWMQPTEDQNQSKKIMSVLMLQNCCRLLKQAFSHSLLLLNLTGANWVATGDAEKTQDRQTENGIRCAGCLGGDAQQPHCFFSLLFSSFTLFLFSIFII
jgi:hypothetical protein